MGKDTDLLQAIRHEDVAMVMKIVAKYKSKSKKSGPTKKIPLNIQDTDGFSGLHHAALSGNCNVLHCLLESNLVIVDIKDNKGMRPLHYAAWQGKLEPVVLLLKAGASPNDVSLEGDTPLHQASQYGSFQVAEVLLQYHADPTIKNKSGKTALDLAAEFGKLGVVNLLLSSPQSDNLIAPPRTHMNVNMHTPLHLAAKNGHSDVIKVLLQSGVDINMETNNGTALHEASLFGKTEVVRLLINYGINVHQKNSHGQTALDIVNKFTSTKAAQDIKQMLREAIGGFRARALQDYCKIHDRSCLSFKRGEIINILEQHPNGRWKGTKETDKNKAIGYFPANLVEIIQDSPTKQGSRTLTLPSHSFSTKQPGRSANPLYGMCRSFSIGSYAALNPSHSLEGLTCALADQHSTDSINSACSSGHWSCKELSEYMQQSRQDSSCQQPLPTSNMAPMHIPTVAHQSYSDFPSCAAVPKEHLRGSNEMIPTSRNTAMLLPSVISLPTSTDHISSPGHHQKENSPAHIHKHHDTPQNAWPRRPIINGDNSEEESGVDVSSSTESMERKQKIHQDVGDHQHSIITYPAHHAVKPKPSRSCENVLSENSMAPSPKRPYSDCPPLQRIENEIPSLDTKDADRIYEWLKRLRLPEYTNNFTKAGYDMPTIAKMTPEDLTAVGITVPGHRKKMFAMIQQMKEPDVAPNFKPPDVQSWLRILDLEDYYNTLISNGYDQIEYLHDMTWEDLQEIGIIRLGHQKKLMLALKRLREIKKHEKQALDAASLEDLTTDTASVQKLTSSPSFENVAITVRHKSAIQGSLESIGSDISNISGGSIGSKGSNDSYPRKLMLQRNPNMSMNNQAVSTYVPCMTTVKSSPTKVFIGPPEKDIPEEHDAESVYQNVSFSTFKQSSGGSPKAVPTRSASVDSPVMERMIHKNSIGSSSTSDQGSLKNKLENPYKIPKRGNSMHSVSDKPLMTATIGRRKSLKQFKAALDNGTAIDDLRSTQVPGYATIKRTPSRRTDAVRLHRHLSQEHDDTNLTRPSSSGSFTSDTSLDQIDGSFQNENKTLPDVTQSGSRNVRGSPVHLINRTVSNENLTGDASSIIPASYHSAKQQYCEHTNGKQRVPVYYQTLRRLPRKSEPLADDFRPRSRSFTDKDEHMQSPVRKSPPASFRSNEGIDKNQSRKEQQNVPQRINVSQQEQNIPVQTYNNDSPFKKPYPPPPIALKPTQRQSHMNNGVEDSHNDKQLPCPLNKSQECQSRQSKPSLPAKQKQINNAIKQQQQMLQAKEQQQIKQHQHGQYMQQKFQHEQYIQQNQLKKPVQQQEKQGQRNSEQEFIRQQHQKRLQMQEKPVKENSEQQFIQQHHQSEHQKLELQQKDNQPQLKQMKQHQHNLQQKQQLQQQWQQKQIQESFETSQRKVPGFRVSSFGKNTNPPKKPSRSNSLRLELVTAASTVKPVPSLVNVKSPDEQYAVNLHNQSKQFMSEQEETVSEYDMNCSKTSQRTEQFNLHSIQNNAEIPSPNSQDHSSIDHQILNTVERHGDQKLPKYSPNLNLFSEKKPKMSISSLVSQHPVDGAQDVDQGIHRPKTANLGASDTDTVLRLHSPKHRHHSDGASQNKCLVSLPKAPSISPSQSCAKAAFKEHEHVAEAKLVVKEPSVDLYSADFDQLDGMDDAVESDSSDVDLLSGFENENTDTIKKQPTKQIVRDIQYEDKPDDRKVSTLQVSQSEHSVYTDPETLLLKGVNQKRSSSSSIDDHPPPPAVDNEYLHTDLNISEDDLPLPPPPSHLLPTVPGSTVGDQVDVFEDIESMFNNLAEDLASMMK